MIYGCFYFIQTDIGNLYGEYTNNGIEKVVTECANIKEKGEASFVGTFTSTWAEKDGPIVNKLIIEPDNNKYTLKWIGADPEKPIFYGYGFIVDGKLIGNYFDNVALNKLKES